jgi:biofilm PGA synthesis N-glycosyltransferase PgaC
MWGTFQGIIGHKVGRRATRFDLAYLGLLLDWLLFTLVTPIILAVVIVVNLDNPDNLAHTGLLYAAWAAIGAIAIRKWRLLVLFPALLIIDWIARVNLVHAAIKAIRQPTAACRWESPQRYAVAA